MNYFHKSKVIALYKKSEIWNSSIIHTCLFEIKQFQKRFKWDSDQRRNGPTKYSPFKFNSGWKRLRRIQGAFA